MPPLLAERVVAVPVSVPVPIKQGESLTVDLDMPRAKVQYERHDDRAADPPAPLMVAPAKTGKNGGKSG